MDTSQNDVTQKLFENTLFFIISGNYFKSYSTHSPTREKVPNLTGNLCDKMCELTENQSQDLCLIMQRSTRELSDHIACL